MMEQLTTTLLEKTYLTETRRNIYVACEDMNFIWDEKQVYAVIDLYRKGATVYEIASDPGINRDPDEVAVLIMDLARKGIIKTQDWGRNRK